MQEGQLLMTQAERDRLVTLKKAKKRLIAQREAAEELGDVYRGPQPDWSLVESQRIAPNWGLRLAQ